MGGHGDYHTNWSKSDRERQILCVITYMWNLNNKQIDITKDLKDKNQTEDILSLVTTMDNSYCNG